MPSPLRLAGQIAIYGAFILFVGYFSVNPSYVQVDPGKALIKLSFSHAGARKGECRNLGAEELARLPPNMRRPRDCPRERVDVFVQLLLDGEVVYQGSLSPTGIARDGASTAYERFEVDAGAHKLVARLRDSGRAEGFDYEKAIEVDLVAQQNFVIDFRAEAGGFIFM
jgi:hypothetical protein